MDDECELAHPPCDVMAVTCSWKPHEGVSRSQWTGFVGGNVIPLALRRDRNVRLLASLGEAFRRPY